MFWQVTHIQQQQTNETFTKSSFCQKHVLSYFKAAYYKYMENTWDLDRKS